jgi:hypothetical protein
MGGIYRGGDKKNPYVIIGGEGVYSTYPNKVINMTGCHMLITYDKKLST